MARRVVFHAGFVRAYHKLSTSDRGLIDAALARLEHYLHTGHAPLGLGLKHLGRHIYEFRVGLALRVVYVTAGEEIIAMLVGTHDAVRRFLKRQ